MDLETLNLTGWRIDKKLKNWLKKVPINNLCIKMAIRKDENDIKSLISNKNKNVEILEIDSSILNLIDSKI